jgi:hypothetical protein
VAGATDVGKRWTNAGEGHGRKLDVVAMAPTKEGFKVEEVMPLLGQAPVLSSVGSD